MRNDEFASGGTRQSSLSDKDHAVLQMASRDGGIDHHANEIFESLGMRTTQFAMHLNRLLDNPDANAEYPNTVNRWRGLRDRRVAQQSERRKSLRSEA